MSPAFALTEYKAQGSTYRYGVLDLTRGDAMVAIAFSITFMSAGLIFVPLISGKYRVTTVQMAATVSSTPPPKSPSERGMI